MPFYRLLSIYTAYSPNSYFTLCCYINSIRPSLAIIQRDDSHTFMHVQLHTWLLFEWVLTAGQTRQVCQAFSNKESQQKHISCIGQCLDSALKNPEKHALESPTVFMNCMMHRGHVVQNTGCSPSQEATKTTLEDPEEEKEKEKPDQSSPFRCDTLAQVHKTERQHDLVIRGGDRGKATSLSLFTHERVRVLLTCIPCIKRKLCICSR